MSNERWNGSSQRRRKKLSELVNHTPSEGPHKVTHRNDVVSVLAESNYEQLTVAKSSFKDFLLQNSPSLEGIDLVRDRSPLRDVAF